MNQQTQIFRQGLAELDERCCWLKSKTGLLWKAAATVLALYLIALTASWMLGDLGKISSIDIPAELAQLFKDVGNTTGHDQGIGLQASIEIEAIRGQLLEILSTYFAPAVCVSGMVIAGISLFSGELASALKIAVFSLMLLGAPRLATTMLGIDDPSSSATSSYVTFTSAVEEGRAQDVEYQLKSIAQSGKSVDSLQVDYLLAQMIVRYHSHPEVREGSFEKTREWYRYNSGIAKRFIDALVARQGKALFEIDAQNLSAIAHFVHSKPYPQAAIDFEASQSWKLAILAALEKVLIALLAVLVVLSTGVLLIKAMLTGRADRIRSLLGDVVEREQAV
ncbi:MULTISPECIES: hypothetical protein [Pseudomonas]|uniref:hypothetical protein n=1 Tax=Pseudomonas sp. MAG002Y TaxID=2678690 RepID=UPI00031ECD45|nr:MULTISPECIES: hypothetical protein [Pseudomonas]MBW5416326.1 hypothetical protein [Pseudomonas sp. MAG002Y]